MAQRKLRTVVKKGVALECDVHKPNFVRRQLDKAFSLETLLPDGMTDPHKAFPYSTIDQMRQSLVHNIMKKYASLAELQQKAAIDVQADELVITQLTSRPQKQQS